MKLVTRCLAVEKSRSAYLDCVVGIILAAAFISLKQDRPWFKMNGVND